MPLHRDLSPPSGAMATPVPQSRSLAAISAMTRVPVESKRSAKPGTPRAFCSTTERATPQTSVSHSCWFHGPTSRPSRLAVSGDVAAEMRP